MKGSNKAMNVGHDIFVTVKFRSQHSFDYTKSVSRHTLKL
jgi:hypothetical protein